MRADLFGIPALVEGFPEVRRRGYSEPRFSHRRPRKTGMDAWQGEDPSLADSRDCTYFESCFAPFTISFSTNR